MCPLGSMANMRHILAITKQVSVRFEMQTSPEGSRGELTQRGLGRHGQKKKKRLENENSQSRVRACSRRGSSSVLLSSA